MRRSLSLFSSFWGSRSRTASAAFFSVLLGGGLLYEVGTSTDIRAAEETPLEVVSTAITGQLVEGEIAPNDVEESTSRRKSATEMRVDAALGALESKVEEKSHPDAFRLAVQAYYNYQAENPDKVRNPYFYFVDFGLDSRTPRGYVFDMKKMEVVEGPFTVAHGRGSASGAYGVPTRFSNVDGSNATSLGLYLTQETYAFRGKSGGRPYRSTGLRLRGLSEEYNSLARSRGIVVHGAPYVSASAAKRSEGCPAMEQDRAERLLPKISNGGLVFHFSPLEKEWMRADRWANAGMSLEDGRMASN